MAESISIRSRTAATKKRKLVVGVSILVVLSLLGSFAYRVSISQAMLYAAEQGDIKKVKSLLDKGADPNEKDPELGTTAIMAAVGSGNIEVVRLLLNRGADPTLTDNAGFNAITQAQQDKRDDFSELLKKKTN